MKRILYKTILYKTILSFILILTFGLNALAQQANTRMPKKDVNVELLNDLVEDELNYERRKRGLSLLTHIDYFENYAMAHSKVICKSEKPVHSATENDDRISGECIDMRAKMGFDDKTYGEYAKEIVHGWMTSPDHKDIILTPELTEFGVGIAEGFYRYGGYKMNALYSTLVVN